MKHWILNTIHTRHMTPTWKSFTWLRQLILFRMKIRYMLDYWLPRFVWIICCNGSMLYATRRTQQSAKYCCCLFSNNFFHSLSLFVDSLCFLFSPFQVFNICNALNAMLKIHTITTTVDKRNTSRQFWNGEISELLVRILSAYRMEWQKMVVKRTVDNNNFALFYLLKSFYRMQREFKNGMRDAKHFANSTLIRKIQFHFIAPIHPRFT